MNWLRVQALKTRIDPVEEESTPLEAIAPQARHAHDAFPGEQLVGKDHRIEAKPI